MSRANTRADAINRGATEGEREFGLREWIDTLPSGRHADKMATFDTRIRTMRHLPGSAAKGAAKAARRHGYESAGPAESFYVDDVGGPLLTGELDRAEAWGKQLGAATSVRRGQRYTLPERETRSGSHALSDSSKKSREELDQ